MKCWISMNIIGQTEKIRPKRGQWQTCDAIFFKSSWRQWKTQEKLYLKEYNQQIWNFEILHDLHS